jgi:hypothetical protein
MREPVMPGSDRIVPGNPRGEGGDNILNALTEVLIRLLGSAFIAALAFGLVVLAAQPSEFIVMLFISVAPLLIVSIFVIAAFVGVALRPGKWL